MKNRKLSSKDKNRIEHLSSNHRFELYSPHWRPAKWVIDAAFRVHDEIELACVFDALAVLHEDHPHGRVAYDNECHMFRLRAVEEDADELREYLQTFHLSLVTEKIKKPDLKKLKELVEQLNKSMDDIGIGGLYEELVLDLKTEIKGEE